MSRSTSTGEQMPALRQLARWWWGSCERRAATAELGRCGLGESVGVARDVGVSTPALCTLAGKWPACASLSQLTCLNARNPTT